MTCPVIAKKRTRPLYRTGRLRPKGEDGRAPFQIVSSHLQQGSKGGVGGTGRGYAPTIVQPNASGCTRPVRQRHRSAAICRAMATLAFFLAALLALGLRRACGRTLPAEAVDRKWWRAGLIIVMDTASFFRTLCCADCVGGLERIEL